MALQDNEPLRNVIFDQKLKKINKLRASLPQFKLSFFIQRCVKHDSGSNLDKNKLFLCYFSLF